MVQQTMSWTAVKAAAWAATAWGEVADAADAAGRAAFRVAAAAARNSAECAAGTAVRARERRR